jgi:hypothetical protein
MNKFTTNRKEESSFQAFYFTPFQGVKRVAGLAQGFINLSRNSFMV